MGPDAHDVGYWVRRSAARQGVAGAAVSALVIHAFEEREVDRLVTRCDVANDASVVFARALGFRPTGEVTTAYPDGTPRPVSRLEMTRESYHEIHAPALRERARRIRLLPGTDAP